MTFNDLVQYYKANVPQDPSAPLGTDVGNNRFNSWTAQLEQQLGIPGGQYDDPSSGWNTITPDTLNQFETTGGGGAAGQPSLNTTGGGVPLEQGLLQTALPGLINQVTGDAGRQQQVTDLTNQANAAYGNLGQTLSQAQAHFDGQAYLSANPDVAANYAQYPAGQTPGTRSINGKDMTADQFAQFHYDNYGKNEGRQPTYTSTVAQQQQGNAATAATAVIGAAGQAAASQLSALQSAITQSTQNLQGNLAAKASALTSAVASLNQNLTTLDASQKANLAAQIQSMQQDLQTSIDAQRTALTSEVQQLQGNSDAAAQARMAALNTELAGLNAAQAPLNAARLQGAEALSTAVNLGLTAAQKDILAKQAAGGFIGGSTMTDAALARATVDARQQAAGAIGSAEVANAADTRDIGVKGATQGYSIADALAGEKQSAANLGATGGAQLSGALAQGTQAIGDTGATALRTIGDSTAGNRAQIGNSAASQTYADTVGGANDLRTLQDTLSTGGYNIATALANNTQQARNTQAGANFSTGQNLFPNSVNAAGALAQLPGQQAATLTSLLPYGNAGLTNTQNALNWWATSNNPPQPTTTITQPSQTGNQVSQLGSGLLGGAFQVGNANNWWSTSPTGTKATSPQNGTYTPDGQFIPN